MNEEEKQIMSIVMEDGTIQEVESLVSFKLLDFDKEYIVYTKNEKDESDNVTVYVSTLTYKEGLEEPILTKVETEEEWTEIKKVLKDLCTPAEEGVETTAPAEVPGV